jgi:glutamyl-tRNA synthetase
MPGSQLVTRFAPSPSGRLHLGNARTALFNYLAARSDGGRFVLRVEDTDAVRSDEAMLGRALDDLHWLGLDWQEGPDVGGPAAPYRQSERLQIYEAALDELAAAGFSYPCFCSPQELSVSRRAQLAAGRPPRYAGTCAALGPEQVAARRAAGQVPAIRFRVPRGRTVEFDDLVHGLQRFETDDIGDFVVRRADGSAAFFLSNAVDDARMGITQVIRGDDHLANTPRQILLLEALGLTVPRYAHLPLLLDASGAPLSKRAGAVSVHELRCRGFLPGAICNYLLRLGHVCDRDGWLELAEAPAHFALDGASRSSAHFDEAQLLHWQREAVLRATTAELEAWLGSRLERLPDLARRQAFIEAVRGNLMFPADADLWLEVIGGAELEPDAQALGELRGAGEAFFARAGEAWAQSASDFKAWTRATAESTGRKGAALFMPLRAALTGRTHGPELAPIVALIGPAGVERRLAAAGRLAAAEAMRPKTERGR